ncbi:MAG: hypothetical protein HY673_05030 [Chloroflexi bacterium]|nr:hypothetical protein [Chloroflexota bacterium]
MRCATHPDVETNLRCGKCGKLICPKCMVQTPVGARCRGCAGLSRLPTYQVPPLYYFRAVGASIGTGVAVGLLWYLAIAVVPFAGIFNILLAGAAGYVVGVVIGLAVNKKRGWGLAVTGAAGFLLSYVLFMSLRGFGLASLPFFFTSFSGIYQILAILAGVFMAGSQLK